MSSLLTNNSAMVALQTLRTINKDMSQVQGQISTGMKIANSKDNAAVWGIATTMSTDVTGFKAISESLSLGNATLQVARSGAETITDLLDQLKGKVTASQEKNVDRDKIQADVNALVKQIGAVADGAQFNGLNLLKGKDTIEVLSSLDRTSSTNVNTANIAINQNDLSTVEGAVDAASANIAGFAVDGSGTVSGNDTDPKVTLDFTGQAIGATGGNGGAVTIDINGVKFGDLVLGDAALDTKALTEAIYDHVAGQTDKLAEANVVLQTKGAASTDISQITVDGTPTSQITLANTAVVGRLDANDPLASIEFADASAKALGAASAVLTINGEDFTIDLGAAITDGDGVGNAVVAAFASGDNADRLAAMGIEVTNTTADTVVFKGVDGTVDVKVEGFDDSTVTWTTPPAESVTNGANSNADAATLTIDDTYYTPEEGNVFSITLNSGTAKDDATKTFTHVVGSDDTAQSILTSLKNQIDADAEFGTTGTQINTVTRIAQNADGDYQLLVDNQTDDTGETLTVSMDVRDFGVEGQFMGGSASSFDVLAKDGTFSVDVDINLSATANGATDNTEVDPGAVAASAGSVTFDSGADLAAGNAFAVTLDNGTTARTFTQVAGENDTMTDVMNGLKAQIDGDSVYGASGSFSTLTRVARDSNDSHVLMIDNVSGGGTLQISEDAREAGTEAGGLAALNRIDVTTDEGAAAALGQIEGWIQTAVDAAADFGSAQGRMATQTEFVSKLIDGFTSGIGALVDANMEEASAKLQALQVQQQLGVQALSIANQQPQNILALFR